MAPSAYESLDRHRSCSPKSSLTSKSSIKEVICHFWLPKLHVIRQEIPKSHIGKLRDRNSCVDHREQCRRPHRNHSRFHVRDFMSCCMYHMLSSTRTVPRHQPFHYAGHNLPLLCQRPCTALRMCSDDLTSLPIRTELVGNNTVGCIR